MNSENLIKNAIKYYDEKSEKFGAINKDNVILHVPSNKESDIIEPNIDININKIKYKGNFSLLGEVIKYNNINMFRWAWSDNKSKNLTYLTRKILYYGLDITNEENLDLKQILLNSVVELGNILSLETLIAISLYLTKSDWMIIDRSSGNVDIFMIYNIKKN